MSDVEEPTVNQPRSGQASSAPAVPLREDRYTELERLASLRDRGVLTATEFASVKARVLAATATGS